MDQQLLAVIVLYKKKLSDCPSYETFLYGAVNLEKFSLYIYDNSPVPQTDDLLDLSNVHYIHDADNPGLAKAYNAALDFCNEANSDLLLLLDQDTAITVSDIEYIMKFSAADTTKMGALVPNVYSGQVEISPVFSNQYISRERSYPEVGVAKDPVMAINSGSVLTKKGRTAISKFNEEFPLDFLDHWVFWKLNKEKAAVYVLPLKLQHNLSVLDYRQVSLARYESIVTAETLFYTKYDTAKLDLHKKHLLKRILKQFLTVKNRKIWRRTWAEYRRLVRSKT
ncbi:glycosyltransferase [Enterococcus sp. LJL128]